MASIEENGSNPKRQKLTDLPERGNADGAGDEDERGLFFKDFTTTSVLREDTKAKLMTLKGKFNGKDGDAVVLLEKLPFDKETVANLMSSSTMHQTLNNDIYSTYEAFPPTNFPDYKTTMIYPATEKHVIKYSEQDMYVVRETKDLYENVTKQCLEKNQFSIQWVYNILEKKCESERIVFEDPDPVNGFILLPDLKWNRKDLDSLYLVAITHNHIKSLRDLNKESLPLLKNILKSGTEAIEKEFNIPVSKLRIYVHYQPSYYHLHVHFSNLKFDAPGTDVLRAHLLDSIIENIEMDSQYYENKTLHYTVKENDVLHQAYKDHGYFK
ncbi:hypothetical protein LOTGIDRAFT_234493 [Lottia gigantea]|uniref:m7GpppX diphosphatase n=1 Tax=Lottia gigantea TaxID=225164 RepID=V4A584_LOTGI|nr:hypothetical protein LOTGIDRAFT_234493 [Lottia gigantea]ESO88401.1 hypothetical protein LOTGIDRAFT_234493 [Lottia gigantea]